RVFGVIHLGSRQYRRACQNFQTKSWRSAVTIMNKPKNVHRGLKRWTFLSVVNNDDEINSNRCLFELTFIAVYKSPFKTIYHHLF
ncbi:MAG: hypothetical protein IJH61_08870, partial [Eubacteriaceae bacterium]|nr:hypothetical protein [Eubacteriaceae bacterium]